MIDKIIEIINRDRLSTRDRHRFLVHKRAFLFAVLRENGYSLDYIGKLFNRTHATVIHGLNGYEYWTKHKDELFYEDVSEYMDIFGYKKIEIKKSYNLVEDIKNCRQFKDVETIKRRIANEVY